MVTSIDKADGGVVVFLVPTFEARSGSAHTNAGSGRITPETMRLLIAGTVALAFLALVSLLVGRLANTARPARTIFAAAALLASLPPVLYAFLPRA